MRWPWSLDSWLWRVIEARQRRAGSESLRRGSERSPGEVAKMKPKSNGESMMVEMPD